MFLDGDSDPPTQPSGPPLRHFRNVTLKEVNTSAIRVWDQLLKDVELPTTGIVWYNKAGDPIERREDENTSANGNIVFDIFSTIPEEGGVVQTVEKTVSENTAGQEGKEIEHNISGATWMEKETGEATESHEKRVQAERKSGQPEESEKIVEVERINIQKTELRTKNAMEIMKVIGDCDELKEFDELRYRLKSAKKISQGDKLKYRQVFYKLQLIVQRKRTSLIEQIAFIERRYHREHGKLPSEKDCKDVGILMEKCRHINKLL